MLLLLLLSIIPLSFAEYPCPDGLYSIYGACTPPDSPNNSTLPDCPIGQWPGSSNGLCVPKPHCLEDKAAVNGTCVSKCGPGEVPDEDECVECTPPSVLVNGVCKRCPPGTRPTNNQCPFDCPVNMKWGSDRCVSACGWNEASVNGECQRVCPGTQYLYGTSDCRDTCDNGLFYHEELCVEVCPAGFDVKYVNVCVMATTPPFS